MAIGFRRDTSFALESMLSDSAGRFLFLRGSLGGMPCTLATLYAPNRNQAGFIATTLKRLKDFARRCILLAGDFNNPLEPLLDTSQGRSSISHKSLSYIRKGLYDAQLIDIWRLMHPRMRDYTHYSHVHHTYSKIDFFFIDHHHLSLHISADIETSPISDHSPTMLKLKIPSMPLRTTNWKLNEDLKNGEIDKKLIGEDLSLYTHPDISPGILWEAHKAYNRGKRIELGARKKRQWMHQQSELIRDIGILEQQHKAGQSQAVFHTLTLKREELKALFHVEQKQLSRIVDQRLHEWGNKSGPILASSLQQKKKRFLHR